jgi:hypothetical protein
MSSTLCGPETHITLRYDGPNLHATVRGGGFFNEFVVHTGNNKAVLRGAERQEFVADVRREKEDDYFEFILHSTEDHITFTNHMHKLIHLETLTMRLMQHMASVPGCTASELEFTGECFQIANGRGQSICIHYGGWDSAPVYLQGMDTTPFEADYDVRLVEDDVFEVWFKLPEEYDEMKALIDKAIRIVF